MENKASEETSTTLLDLPPELIRGVMIMPSMTMTDISRLAQTCHLMNELVSEDCNDVWRTMHLRRFVTFGHDQLRWPEANKALLEASEVDWHAECKLGFHLMTLTANLMDEIWPKVYCESEVCYSHFSPLRQTMDEHKSAYIYIKDFLVAVINDKNTDFNLTQKFQAKQILSFIRQEYITAQWNIFKGLPEEKKLLEHGVGYVSQWCQPLLDMSPEYLGNRLDQLTSTVLDHLAECHPDHPIFTVPQNERKKWGIETLPCDKWNANHCMQILRSIDHVLIECLGFHGTKEHYDHRENYLIDQVISMQQGVPIALNVIVECIARRLGVRTEPWFRGHFVLMWKSDANPELGEVYLDVCNTGSLIHSETYVGNTGFVGPYRNLTCPKGPASCIEIVERLTAGIEVAGRISTRNTGNSSDLRSALELMFVIHPKNLTYILHLARLYMLHNISVSNLIETIMSIMDELPDDARYHAENILRMFRNYSPEAQSKPPPMPRTREMAPHVRFAVGMSMVHKQYNYLCVITGWDPICTATDIWKEEMGVQWLTYKDNQPFYNVLVPDGTTRYAAQENLEPLNANDAFNVLNKHPDLGRYFESYQNGYYVPNCMKLAEYPDDPAVCQQFYALQ
ncbi:hypothetical protein ONE63_005344 [Megalurothrips usitatus]|uniref:Hemimethylated DNA-binding domain-containing protein n=1 Tax=Megalurothrips usitatus TaxID=439358 RepID=A0AAV7XV38_9NEOP|nr:hypothetical protein ONE63_005344 [Megalurothrips usitatus]